MVLCALALLASGCGAAGRPSPPAMAREVNLRPGDMGGARSTESPPRGRPEGPEEAALARCAGLPVPPGGERFKSATVESEQWTARSEVLTPPDGTSSARFAAALRAEGKGLETPRGLACWSHLVDQKWRHAGVPSFRASIRPLPGFPGAVLATRFTTSNVAIDGGASVRSRNVGDLIEGVRGNAAFELSISNTFVVAPLAHTWLGTSPPPRTLELRLYDTLARRLDRAQHLAR